MPLAPDFLPHSTPYRRVCLISISLQVENQKFSDQKEALEQRVEVLTQIIDMQGGGDDMRGSSSGFGGSSHGNPGDDGDKQAERLSWLETELFMKTMQVADLSNAIKNHPRLSEETRKELFKAIAD